MRRMRDGSRAGFARLGLAIGALILAGGDAVAQEPPRYEIFDFGVQPRPAVEPVLLSMEPVLRELGFTEAQKKEQEAIEQRRVTAIRQARRDIKETAKLQAAARDIIKEAEAAHRASFRPGQQARLDQIQLQAQGPLAFGEPGFPPAYEDAPLDAKLGLSQDQVRRVRAIAESAVEEIKKAAGFPIALDSRDKPPAEEAILKLVDSPEFREAKKKARLAARDAWAAAIGRIEAVLDQGQRETYRKLLGVPFDLASLELMPAGQERQVDVAMVGRAFGRGGGQGGGQRSDPDFDTKVARPAYPDGSTHPRVLFDEAHHNFHTTGGRYKPFGQLIGNDGYRVIPNREKFTAEVLGKGDILVIANALGAEGMGQPGAADPAFTDAECVAVRDWVKAGGSLLFITDHAPMGSAAQCLAKRFEVDLSTGATSDPANSENGETSLVFSRQNHLLGDHPITRGRDDAERVNKVQTFTGTSMKGPASSVALYKLADTAVDNSFDEEGKTTPASGRAQGIAFAHGKGRVVLLGEAAEMSAQLIGDQKFGMNVPGLDNRQMALNVMHWLSGLLDPRKGN